MRPTTSSTSMLRLEFIDAIGSAIIVDTDVKKASSNILHVYYRKLLCTDVTNAEYFK